MLKTYLYIPDQLQETIVLTAKTRSTSRAAIMRQALERGLTAIEQEGDASVQAMQQLAELGERLKPKGPKDLSSNLDKHLWGIKGNE